MNYLQMQRLGLLPKAPSGAHELIGFLGVLWLVYSCAFKCADASPLGLHQEFVHCMERGACRFELVCPFSLEADPSRCFMEECHPLEGHVMAVHNALEYAITVHWSPIGNTTLGESVEVAGQTTRYFDTRLPADETHSIGLTVDAQTVAIVLLSPEATTPCTVDETCDYMLRACYGVQEGQEAVDRCVDYARHCHGFEKVDEERRQACIPSCLDTYYGHFFQSENVFAAYDSDLLVAILLELRHRGVDLSKSQDLDLELEGEGIGGGALEAVGFDLCTITQCGGGSGCPSAQEMCHDMTTGIVVIGGTFVVIVAVIGWIAVRRCRASYRHGSTFNVI